MSYMTPPIKQYLENNLTIKLSQPERGQITAQLLLDGDVISQDTIKFEPEPDFFGTGTLFR